MKKIRNIVLGGIQQKIFNLVLITIILVVAAYTAVIFYQAGYINTLVTDTNNQQKQSIIATSRETMDAVIQNSLGTDTQMEAMIADNLFKNLAGAVSMLGDYAEKILDNPEAYSERPVEAPDPSTEGVITAQLLTEDGTNAEDPQLSYKLGLMGNMSEMMTALYRTSRISSCYVALPDGAMIMVDDHAAARFSEDGNLISIPIRERPWYTGAVETGSLFFTDVVTDVFSGQIGIMCAMPVYHDGELGAVVGADLFLDTMANAVNATGENGRFVCIINDKGHVVFSPRTDGEFRVRPPEEAEDLRKAENSELASFVKEAIGKATDVQIISLDGEEYYAAGAPIGTVGWAVISGVSRAVADQPTVRMEREYEDTLNNALLSFRQNYSASRSTILVLLAVVTILGLAAALILSKRIVKPLNTITERVQSLGGNRLQFQMEKTYRTGDEIEVLAESFAKLSAKTLQYVEQVKTVTAEKERISAELNMATAIQASQLPRLFPAFPDRPEFDVYATMIPAKEVGGDFYDFFLVDEDHIALVMADVSGKGVPAALFMMVSRVLIKSRVQNGESPGEALANVNNQLCEGNEPGFFVTVWLGILEISTGKGIAANAGHEHPAICRRNGSYELSTYRHSPAVAAMENIRFREHEFELNPGDRLFVYTDGVTEATNQENELFGTSRMLKALNSKADANPEETIENVMNGIRGFVADAEQFDDITMLSLKYLGPQNNGRKKTDKNK